MNNFSTFRFIIPPIISIASVFILFFSYLEEKINHVLEYDGSGQILFGIIISSTVLLALGFIISSLANLIVVQTGLNVTDFREERVNKNIKKYNLKEVYIWACLIGNDNNQENDINKRTWEYIEQKISKRWEMFLISFNSVVGISLVLLIGIILPILNGKTIFCEFEYFFRFLIVVLLWILFYRNSKISGASQNFLKLIMIVFKREYVEGEYNYERFKDKIEEEIEKKLKKIKKVDQR